MGISVLVGANLFVIFFAASWGPVMWVVLGEVFPNRIRGLALGISTSFNWIFNFIVALLFPIMSAAVGVGYVYAGFAFFAVLSFWFVKALLPETSGLRTGGQGQAAPWQEADDYIAVTTPKPRTNHQPGPLPHHGRRAHHIRRCLSLPEKCRFHILPFLLSPPSSQRGEVPRAETTTPAQQRGGRRHRSAPILTVWRIDGTNRCGPHTPG